MSPAAVRPVVASIVVTILLGASFPGNALPSKAGPPRQGVVDPTPVERIAEGAAAEIATLQAGLRDALRERRRERLRAWVGARLVPHGPAVATAIPVPVDVPREYGTTTARLLAAIAARAAVLEPAAGTRATPPVVPGARQIASAAAAGERPAQRVPAGAAPALSRHALGGPTEGRVAELRRALGDARLRLAAAVLRLADTAPPPAAELTDVSQADWPAPPSILPLLRLQPADGLVPWQRAAIEGEGALENEAAIELRVGPDGSVRAPADGRIVFAGPFRDRGAVLIIAHAGGYHSIVSGLGGLSASAGEMVRGGEVIGTVAGSEARPVLRLRHGREAVDPARWAAWRSIEGRG